MSAAGQSGAAVDMPVRAVALYNNGYGVFERKAVVSGRGSIELYFREADMKDVLQSLTFRSENDTSGLGNISYESSRPQALIQLSSSNPLVDLCQSLKGTRLQIVFKAGDSLEGTVLGVDETLRRQDGAEAVPHVTLLTDDGTSLQSMEISTIEKLTILDADVRHDVQHALELFRSEKKRDMQRLTIFYHDIGDSKQLLVKYGLKVGEWKSSYRIVFSDHPSDFKLEGFAIITNTQEEDWTDVELTLVVGAPLFASSSTGSGASANRGTIELQIKELVGTSFYVRADPRTTIDEVKSKIKNQKGVEVERQKLIYAGKELESGRTLSDYNIANGAIINLVTRSGRSAPQTRTSQRKFVMAAEDNLSFYPIHLPVTVKRKQSAVVPLLKAELKGHKVVLYDETIRKGNPLCAILFENTTGRTLDGGSVQVMNETRFLGDAVFQTLHPGDESLPIPYAVDLSCEVVVDYNVSVLRVHRVKIKEGFAKLYRKRRQRTLYRICNKSGRTLDFMLNHLFLDGWELMQAHTEEEEPVDITDKFYQFRFIVPAKTDKKVFNVREGTQDEESIDLDSVGEETLTKWLSKKIIDHQVYDKIKETIGLRSNAMEKAKTIYEKEAEVRDVKDTQTRLRDNILALKNFEKDSAKYVKSLSAEEDKLKALFASIKALRQEKSALEKKRKDMINRIEFTCDVKGDDDDEVEK
ncbi:uncharacterized protein [Oscarella lobularis]|uniref:uncharacterized protein n=1 Tax=Oscarella lobularis TaxID=121494 RepID=UPI0033140A24